MKYWGGGKWEQGQRIIPDQECEYVADLIRHPQSSLVDLCCGDGNILERVKDRYPEMTCIGIDLYIDDFETKSLLESKGIVLYKESIDAVVYHEFDKLPADYLVMRNTFGTRHIHHLNQQLEIAIFKHFKYFIAQRPTENSPVIANYYERHKQGKMHFSDTECNIKITKENKYYYLVENYGINA